MKRKDRNKIGDTQLLATTNANNDAANPTTSADISQVDDATNHLLEANAEDTSGALLSVINVTKLFNNTTCVLDNVSINIYKGDFVSIVGASGSGKSTLLTIMGGIDKPTSGAVLLDDEDITKKTEKELAILRRTKLGYVFQFFNLAPYLTVYENIMLPVILAGKPTAASKQRAAELMEYLGIASQRDKLPPTLSGGEQQRVAIARGLIVNPKLILLDEPTGNLDSKNSKEIMELLRKINKEMQATIVQVTHSSVNAKYGNKIISIQDGKIVQQ